MTTPDERARALRWGRESLTEISADVQLNAEMQARAAGILTTYPTDDEIETWIVEDLSHLPPAAAQAIVAAIQLFSHATVRSGSSKATALGLTYTLRHFPERYEVGCWDHPVPGHTLRTWLA